MATARQNKDFTEIITSRYPLDDAVEWIKQNLNPDDVSDIPAKKIVGELKTLMELVSMKITQYEKKKEGASQ